MESNNRKRPEGVVVSSDMDKTIVLKVQRIVKDKLTGKIVRKASKFMAHDEENKCEVGDFVLIEETRPLSRKKRWRVVDILKKKA